MSALSPLLTDLYQLTMALGYFRAGIAQRESCFHLHFRRCPFEGGYAIAAGLEQALDFLEALRFSEAECAYLATLLDAQKQRLFPDDFLQFLRDTPSGLEVDAIPEGTAVFPHEPLLRVSGPLYQAQLVETALLTIVNFQTLVATKASRVAHVAGARPVVEFGLRRAQGVDGGLAVSRAAYLGGCTGTSNVLAGMRYGVPVTGTHAHSWVMAFPDERTAFEAYADAMPGNCIFLVDTYDTHTGVGIAIEVGRQLEARGNRLNGVRLDSGDLTALSKDARAQLDAAGMSDAKVVASNDLDEYRIDALQREGATIDIYGVGTRLSTCYDQPALGGVYKLAALADEHGVLTPRIKLSEQAIKVSLPGRLLAKRMYDGEVPVGDVLLDLDHSAGAQDESAPLALCSLATGEPVATPEHTRIESLSVPVMRAGQRVAASPALADVRARAKRELAGLPAALKALTSTGEYPVYLDAHVAQSRSTLMSERRSTEAVS
ncbi:MAG: nicotinate phosphoribosyltransferase [Polyangiales bacterium]